MTALAYDFPLQSPGSRPHWQVVDGAAPYLLEREAERTVTELQAAAPGRIAKGLATHAEEGRAAIAFATIAAELRTERLYFETPPATRGPWLLPPPTISGPEATEVWKERVAILRAEIQRRRQAWPADVGKGQRDPAEAQARLEQLEAIHEKYWCQLFAWPSPNGPAPESGTAAYSAWAEPVRAHAAALAAARQPDPEPARA